MSYTYLQEQGEESSADNFSGIPACVLSRLNLIAAASCFSGNVTDACRGSQSGTMCGHSTGDRGEDSSMLSVVGSHARTFQQQDAAKESPASDQDSGRKWPASLAKWDQGTCSWRTHQYSLRGDLELFSETWPRWGLMQGGECWEHITLEETACEIECSYLPPPQASDGPKWYVVKMQSARRRFTDGRQIMLIHAVAKAKGFPDWNRYVANPPFWEAMMGWPIGWTDLQPLETAKYQQWLHSHGKS